MKVLLLIPPEKITHGKPSKTGKIASPPLGVGYIASILEKGGHRVRFMDFAALGMTNLGPMIEMIKSERPDLIGVSFLTINANQAIDFIKEVKKAIDVPVILGGPHPTYFPEDTLRKLPEVQAVVIGEGESSVLSLVEALGSEKGLEDIEGIFFRDKNGNILSNAASKNSYELDEIPPPSRHLYDLGLYRPYPFQTKRHPVATMITSRGCHYAKCTFCYSSVRKTIMHYRRHSVERVIGEIKSLISEYGIREINFLDDDFAAGAQWVNKFSDTIIKEKIDLSWICMSRASSVSKEMLSKMAQAGCWNIFFGIESANQHLLDRINKGITVEQNKNAIRWAHEANIEVSASFMMLLPGEIPADAQRNIRFAKDLDIEYVAFGPTRPLTGTPLYEQCRSYAKEEIPSEFYRRSGDYFIPYTTFIPKGYGREEALRICRKAYVSYYLRFRYVWRMLSKIKSFSDFNRYFQCLLLYLKLI